MRIIQAVIEPEPEECGGGHNVFNAMIVHVCPNGESRCAAYMWQENDVGSNTRQVYCWPCNRMGQFLLMGKSTGKSA